MPPKRQLRGASSHTRSEETPGARMMASSGSWTFVASVSFIFVDIANSGNDKRWIDRSIHPSIDRSTLKQTKTSNNNIRYIEKMVGWIECPKTFFWGKFWDDGTELCREEYADHVMGHNMFTKLDNNHPSAKIKAIFFCP